MELMISINRRNYFSGKKCVECGTEPSYLLHVRGIVETRTPLCVAHASEMLEVISEFLEKLQGFRTELRRD